MSEHKAVLVWCPFPDRESARVAAHQLLAEKLIACANMIGGLESIFEWNGELKSEPEVGVLFKTTNYLSAEMITRLGAMHPYDTPAIIGWQGDTVLPATLQWLAEECRPDTD